MSDLTPETRQFADRAVEAFVRVALVAILAAWCFEIVRPFVVPAAWGVIIAIGLFPGYRRLCEAMGGRRVAAAVLVSLLLLTVLVVPAVLLSGSLVQGAQGVVRAVEQGTLDIPPPPDWVLGLPLVGTWLAETWGEASEDLDGALAALEPQLGGVLRWLAGAAAGAGIGILQFVVAIAIAAVLLVHAPAGRDIAFGVGRRLAGARGVELTELVEATVRSVTRGILAVAVIQSTLAGLGWLAADIPGAGLLAVLALLLCTVQIGIFPITIPTVIYYFFQADTLSFVLFLVWTVFVSSIDNILKPILLGRGVKVPMGVVFVGAIGGLLSAGIIGLFVGAVVLVLGYKLFLAWLAEARSDAPEGGLRVSGGESTQDSAAPQGR